MMWEYFSDKSILITGGTGFLGTALVLRLSLQAHPKHIYLLCRGGKTRAIQKWREFLPGPLATTLISSESITYLDGNIKYPSLGLADTSLVTLKKEAEIIIHAASSINLVDPLGKLSQSIIGATERLAHIALECPHLQRFVYISTAFANSHLYAESRAVDIPIREELYPLSSIPTATSWKDVQNRGSSEEYEANEFPWDYAYAKHLSERVLAEAFDNAQAYDKLLIIRPSIFGPAQSFPYAGYSVPLSTPLTALAAMVAITPSVWFKAATRARDPDIEVTADEVPVDVVVDRLLFHLRHGSTGYVHAVCGERGRYRFKDLWEDGMAIRKLPWRPRVVWLDVDWHSSQLHYITRFYVLFGPSFNFSEDRTTELWDRVPESERQGLNVYKDYNKGFDLRARIRDIRYCARALASHFGFPSWVGKLLL
ncbi:male sterility domain-containing protein [Aspergillus sclerotioniger CBS 115572]|uniref:Fatty acyl-CoA reductase n=1 Tax=Aspergillus sclerotioniger CBS 115572 TaxID=1450535 RepID=A0A317XA16_9EURO|nr:male sterility domain-containing protein [Aspergillus sclerotioniger CBS 115572]PWY94492.1 male sterility domain-containing protein [Aspergillus sclerotioniger CBS 115572]